MKTTQEQEKKKGETDYIKSSNYLNEYKKTNENKINEIKTIQENIKNPSFTNMLQAKRRYDLG